MHSWVRFMWYNNKCHIFNWLQKGGHIIWRSIFISVYVTQFPLHFVKRFRWFVSCQNGAISIQISRKYLPLNGNGMIVFFITFYVTCYAFTPHLWIHDLLFDEKYLSNTTDSNRTHLIYCHPRFQIFSSNLNKSSPIF